MKKEVNLPASRWLIPPVLLLLCILSYSLFAPSLGFHWDDWLQLLVKHNLGSKAYWAYFAYDRPTSAWTHILLMPILGENPARWQIFTMLMRWLTAVNIWWCFSLLWPKYKRQAAMTAMLFAVYPTFTQQAISLAYHQHMLQYALFAFSLAAMVKAARSPNRFWLFTWLAVLAEILQLTITEFYCGVDLIRPVLLWIIFNESQPDKRARLKKTVLHWLPYLVPLVGYTFWRLFILEFPIPEPHSLGLVAVLRSSPIQGLIQLGRYALTDTLYILTSSWQGAISLRSALATDGDHFYSWMMGILAAMVAFFGICHQWPQKNSEPTHQDQNPDRNWFFQAILIGLLVTLLGPVPIWLTGAQSLGDVHANRFALGSMFGASLLIVAVIEWAAHPGRHAKAIMLALLIGLAVSFHVRVSNDYRKDQAGFRSFFWQLSVRAPHIEPYTALIAHDETYPAQLSTVAAALNLAYPAPASEPQNLAYWAYRIQPNAEPAASLPTSLQNQYRTMFFKANAADSLVLFQKPNEASCLWVLNEADLLNPDIPENLRAQIPLSNMARIQSQPANSGYPPRIMFGNAPDDRWCYLFEEAELAVQEKDWASMEELLMVMEYFITEPDYGNVREWLPFIKGYAHNTEWDTALDLTRQTAEANPAYTLMLCHVWQDIADNVPASSGKENTLQTVQGELACGEQ